MPSIPETPSPERRRPFEGQTPPEPFHRSPEFQRFVWLAAALGVAVLMVFMALKMAAQRGGSERATTAAAPSPAPRVSAEEQAARDVKLHTLFEGSLADTHNGEGFAETSGYHRLLQIVDGYLPEEVARLATKKLDWAAATADPDAWRGEFVWTRGVVAHRWAERLQDPVNGHEDVYRFILSDGDGSEGVVIDMLGEPPPVAIQSDPVDVQGIFYRTLKFENAERKTKEVAPPYLLVKTMKPVELPRRDATGILRQHGPLALAGMAIAILAARLLIYVFQRRSRRPGTPRPAEPAGFRNMFEKRWRGEKGNPGPRSPS